MLFLVFEGVYSVALDSSLRPWMLSLHHACTHIIVYALSTILRKKIYVYTVKVQLAPNGT